MALTFTDYANALREGIYIPKARISLLRYEDESPYRTITGEINGGTLDVSRGNGVRRTVNISLENIAGDFIPNRYNIWVNRKFSLELGLEINGQDIFFPQGVFVVRNPEAVSTSSSGIVNLNGVDKFSLFDGTLAGRLRGTYIIPVGNNINTEIAFILNLFLDNPTNQIPYDANDPILQSLPSGLENTPYTIREELGGNYGNVLIQLNNMLSRNMYYNEVGRLVFENDIDDSVKGSLWDFVENEPIYLGATQNYDFEGLRNVVVVVGDNVNGEIFDATAEDRSTQSDTSINVVGDLVTVIEDPIIYTTALAQERADYELKRLNALQSSLNISSIPLYHLDVDKVISVTDSRLGLDDARFLIESFSLPLIPGEIMNISVVRSAELEIGA